MSFEKEIQDAFANFGKRDVTTFSAEVIEVEKAEGVCKVTDGEFEYNVRLASVINDNKDKFFLYPKVGSKVLVSPIEEDIHQLYIDKYSEIEEFNFKVADCEFSIDEAGLNFKRNEESLRSTILELISTIRSMKFTTNTGPTIKLINDADFIALETKFKNLLKAF